MCGIIEDPMSDKYEYVNYSALRALPDPLPKNSALSQVIKTHPRRFFLERSAMHRSVLGGIFGSGIGELGAVGAEAGHWGLFSATSAELLEGDGLEVPIGAGLADHLASAEAGEDDRLWCGLAAASRSITGLACPDGVEVGLR